MDNRTRKVHPKSDPSNAGTEHVVGRLGGQIRVAGKAVLGWDMCAALALAHALGLNPMVAAELLPELEAVMVRRTNEKIAASE